MSKIRFSILEIASVYIGTVIGAGFASGQEIMKFFSSYGYDGIYGILFSGILFSLLGWSILEMVYVYKIKDYHGFIYSMMGSFLGNIMEWVVSLFMFISFCTMLAGTGALLRQQFHVPVQMGIFIMAVLCLVVFFFDIKGIIAVNSILAPLLLIGGILIGIYSIVFKDTSVFLSPSIGIVHSFTQNWIISSIVYVSYNIITSSVILTSLFPIIKSVKVAKWGGILGGASLGMLGLCVAVTTLVHYDKIKELEIPMLGIVMDYGHNIQYIFLFVLFAAIFTTAIANGYGFLTRVSYEFNLRYKLVIPFFIVLAIIFAQIGFSNMVGRIYPLFGYIGIFEAMMILMHFINYKITKKE